MDFSASDSSTLCDCAICVCGSENIFFSMRSSALKGGNLHCWPPIRSKCQHMCLELLSGKPRLRRRKSLCFARSRQPHQCSSSSLACQILDHKADESTSLFVPRVFNTSSITIGHCFPFILHFAQHVQNFTQHAGPRHSVPKVFLPDFVPFCLPDLVPFFLVFFCMPDFVPFSFFLFFFPLSFVLCPLSFVLCPLSFVLCPLSFVLYPLSFVLRPSSFVLCPLSSVLCLLSLVFCLLSFVFVFVFCFFSFFLLASLPACLFLFGLPPLGKRRKKCQTKGSKPQKKAIIKKKQRKTKNKSDGKICPDGFLGIPRKMSTCGFGHRQAQPKSTKTGNPSNFQARDSRGARTHAKKDTTTRKKKNDGKQKPSARAPAISAAVAVLTFSGTTISLL